MRFLLQFFTWWNEQTLGTRFYTWRKGQLVGTDAQGNKYYQTADGKRRWVIYNGVVEASRVPPEWHGWLHHTVDTPPTEEAYTPKAWEKEHQPNLTGTPFAHRPSGSLHRSGERPPATGDYDAWSPGV